MVETDWLFSSNNGALSSERMDKRMVRTIKEQLKVTEGQPLQEVVDRFLLMYRNTPMEETGGEPARLMVAPPTQPYSPNQCTLGMTQRRNSSTERSSTKQDPNFGYEDQEDG